MTQDSGMVTTITTEAFDSVEHRNQFEKQVQIAAREISNPIFRKGFEFAVLQSLKQATFESLNEAPGLNQLINERKSSQMPQISVQQSRYQYSRSKKIETIFGKVCFYSEETRIADQFSDDEEDIDEELSLWKTTIIVHPASWVIQCGLNHSLIMTNENSLRGYSFKLSMPRTIPNDSPIFKICRTGDIVGVRDILSSRQASVFDIDSEGWTLLHVSLPFSS
jgi:hypothetical protein